MLKTEAEMQGSKKPSVETFFFTMRQPSKTKAFIFEEEGLYFPFV